MQQQEGGSGLVGWARIDDGFDDHPKVLALLDREGGGNALALWLLCLTWAHRNTRKTGKVPGLVPPSLPRRYLGPSAQSLAELLVEVGLWEDEGDRGWAIHDFIKYLPTEETRNARSEAGKRGEAARWGAKGDSKPPPDDGKLPSPSHDGDSNLMAGDGSQVATECDAAPPDAENDAQGSACRTGDHDGISGVVLVGAFGGKRPDADGNLPSPSQDRDSNPVARDGSRAPTRRVIPKGITPGPSPVPEDLKPSTSEIASRPADAASGNRPDGGLGDPGPLRSDVERICAHLADRIEANGSKRPAVTARWRDAARLMLDRDGHTEDQVRAAIDWCQDDSFWRANILSMPKLREQYDRLRLQAAGRARDGSGRRHEAYQNPDDQSVYDRGFR
jgi:hypothetical protein